MCVGVLLLLCGANQVQAQVYEGARQQALGTARAYSAQASQLESEASRLERASPPGIVSQEAIALRAQAAQLRAAHRNELSRVVQMNRAQATLQARTQWGPSFRTPYYGSRGRIRGGVNLGRLYIRF